MNRTFKSLLIASTLSLLSLTTYAAPQPIEGIWRTIDDKTGFAKALVKIEYMPKYGYVGTIIKIIPRPDYTPKEFCVKCPQPFTDRKILGITPLWGLEAKDPEGRLYEGGFILDPLSGHIYRSKAKISADGRRLTMRGYIGISVLGRTQTWIREVDSNGDE